MPADLVDEGLRFEAWTLPSAGTFTRRFDLSKWVNAYTVSDKYNEISDGRMILPSGEAGLPQSRIDQILTVDKQNHANDDGSIIRVLQGTTPIIHYVCKNALDSWQSDNPIVTCSLEGMEFFLDRARVPNYDSPNNPTREPDWIYGHTSVLPNSGFEGSEISNERLGIIVDATAGTWKLGIDYPVGTGFVYTANISFSPGAADIANAIEALMTGWDVHVSGAGTVENPFAVEVLVPAGVEVGWATDVAGLTGTVDFDFSLITKGGARLTDPYTRSLNPTTGVFHGGYITFRISDEQAHTGTYSLKIESEAPASPGAFGGAQIVQSVTPGRLYEQVSVWVYPTTTGPYRFVIRTWDETFIAQAEATLTANSWQQISIPSVTIPSHTNRVIIRVATISNSAVGPWYVDDWLFAPGRAAATYGLIMGDLLAAIQAEGVLTWVTKTWTDTHDSAGVAWDQNLQWAVRRGQALQQLTEYARKWRYENGGLRWSVANDRFEWDLFNPTTGGTNHQGTGLVILGHTGVTSSGTIARRIPDATYFHTEGDAGQWGESEDATLSGVWGKLQKYYPNAQGLDTAGLDILADRLIDDATDRTDGISIRLQASTVRPWQRFRPADKVTVNLAPKRDKELLRCMAIVASKSHSDAAPAYDVHFGSVVYQGEAAVLQSLRTLIRKFDTLVTPGIRETIVGAVTPISTAGSGGAPTVTIAPVDSSVLAKAKADLVSGGGNNDENVIAQALTLLGNRGRILITEGTLTVSAQITTNQHVTFEGMGRGATVIRFADSVDANVRMFNLGQAELGYTGVTFTRLTLDGNEALQSSGTMTGIFSAQDTRVHLVLHDMEIRNFRGSAVEMDRVAGYTHIAQSRFVGNTVFGVFINVEGEATVVGSRFVENGSTGLELQGNQSTVVGNHFFNNGGHGISETGFIAFGTITIAANRAIGNTLTGIAVDALFASNCTVVGNISANNGEDGIAARTASVAGNICLGNNRHGFAITGDGGALSGNLSAANKQHGFRLAGASRWSITGNTSHTNGQLTNNTYDGFLITGSSNGNTVQANRVFAEPTAGQKHRYAINIDSSSCNDNVIVGNDGRNGGLSGSTLGDNFGDKFNNAGTGTMVDWPGSGGGGATDHGALTGLTDDDHTQYLLADGSRAATFLEIDGITGATTNSRYVGATASGAPSTGTFVAGDYVIDLTGSIWVCTVGGSPGTWVEVGATAATDSDAIHDNVAGEISAITAKATPVAGDFLVIEDSEAADAKKKITIGDLPTGSDADAIHDNVAAEISALTQVTPASGDWVLIEDVSDSDNKKKAAAGDFFGSGTDPDAIHDNVSGEISAITEKTTPVSADLILIEDSAASNAKKRVQIGNLLGGSGGGGFLLDPNLKPPGTPHGSDVEFLTSANATDPVTSLGMSWANQNGRSATVKGGILQCTNPSAANNYGGLVVAAPSGTFTMTTRLQSWTLETRHGFGVLVINDSPLNTFANYRWCVRHVNGDQFRVSNISSGWAFGGTNSSQRLLGNDVMPWAYLQAGWNSGTSTLTFRATHDPQAGWYDIAAISSLAAPTFCGFLFTGESASSTAYGSFSFLRFDWTPDFDPTV